MLELIWGRGGGGHLCVLLKALILARLRSSAGGGGGGRDASYIIVACVQFNTVIRLPGRELIELLSLINKVKRVLESGVVMVLPIPGYIV